MSRQRGCNAERSAWSLIGPQSALFLSAFSTNRCFTNNFSSDPALLTLGSRCFENNFSSDPVRLNLEVLAPKYLSLFALIMSFLLFMIGRSVACEGGEQLPFPKSAFVLKADIYAILRFC